MLTLREDLVGIGSTGNLNPSCMSVQSGERYLPLREAILEEEIVSFAAMGISQDISCKTTISSRLKKEIYPSKVNRSCAFFLSPLALSGLFSYFREN